MYCTSSERIPRLFMKRCDHVSVRARIAFRSELISSLDVSSVKPLKYPSHFRVYNLNEREI